MEKYYLLSWKEGKEPIASAFAPKGSQSGHELIKELSNYNELPFELDLFKLDIGRDELIKSDNLSEVKEIWLDYQPNNLAWPIMSEKLKSIIEINLTGNESIDWISCKIRNGNEIRPYFILRFNRMLDVLDIQKTMFVEGTKHIIRPVFASSKVCAYNIFSAPSAYDLWKITSGLYVKDTLKKIIQMQKLTGLNFEKTTIV